MDLNHKVLNQVGKMQQHRVVCVRVGGQDLLTGWEGRVMEELMNLRGVYKI